MSASPSAPAPARHRRPARSQLRRIAPLLLLALGIAALLTARDMGLGELTAPGPGLWPAIAAALLSATAFVLLFLDPAEDYEPWTAGTARIVAGLAGLALFVVLFQTIGFVIPAFLLLFAWLRLLAGESWRMALVLAVAGALVLHLVFVVALGVPFPAGPVDQLLGA
ncbi:tripartite tricarboxylate transporter TctB family protein [Geodermatophilus poikilotrophus]|uniref:Putative tricarboxylic transport membrane protein n=1 Tax=Geodermatophilus poikilotrophus TaxID=1333667 RepID=A0A1I0AX93_9ACTN|nr:tripartite tricarboxylate transporter TctB family protein [Geodermatophilus poikilotrophus]SES98224.1 putative tricarboxylic transport membrane protein [Geodermatophilus poikilotrophus]